MKNARSLRALSGLALLLVLATPVTAQTVQMSATGTVAGNGLTRGPLAEARVGAPVTMTFEVDIPGTPITPGQFENYRIVPSTFRLQAGGVATGMNTSSMFIGLQNNFPVADGVHLFDTRFNTTHNYWLTFELYGAHGNIFNSTKATMEAGTYGPSNFQAIDWWINGGAMSFRFTDFTIHPQGVQPSLMPFGCGVNPASSLVHLKGQPTVGSAFVLGVDNPGGGQTSGSPTALMISLDADPNYPCGTQLPGWGMAAGTAGELLVSVFPPNPVIVQGGPAWAGPGNAAPINVTLPPLRALAGVTLYCQGAIIDVTSPAAIGLSNGMEIVVGS